MLHKVGKGADLVGKPAGGRRKLLQSAEELQPSSSKGDKRIPLGRGLLTNLILRDLHSWAVHQIKFLDNHEEEWGTFQQSSARQAKLGKMSEKTKPGFSKRGTTMPGTYRW
jgi:hypothetical protein